MSTGSWMVIYLPLFVVLLISMQQYGLQQQLVRRKTRTRRRNKERMKMTNELLKQYIGRFCRISTGSYGTTITGKITDIQDNWVAVETRKGIELVNAEYIQSIKVMT